MTSIDALLNTLKLETSSSVNTTLVIIAIILLFSGIFQLRMILSKKTAVNANAIPFTISPPIQNTDFDKKSILGDYHILGSYNSCCIGNYTNDYVSLKQLNKVIQSGIRLVDLEVFTVKGETVVGSSDSDSDFTRRGSKNSIPFSSCLQTIKYSLRRAPNKNDPFFIQIRMKTNIKHSYDEVAKKIKYSLQDMLLSSLYSSNAKYLPYDFENEFMYKLRNKIIIIVHDYSNILESTYLYEYTNIHLEKNSLCRYKDLEHSSDQHNKEMSTRNKMLFSVALPDKQSTKNDSVNKAIDLGFHSLLMNFQRQDSNFEIALRLFALDGNTRSYRLRKDANRNIPQEKTICSNSKVGDNLPVKATINILGQDNTYSSG